MVKRRYVDDQTKKRVLYLLAHYHELPVWEENLKSGINMLQKEILAEPAPKTTQWRESPGGGGFEKPSPEEAALERKERLLQRLKEQERSYNQLKTDKEKLNRSLNGLWENERYVIEICTIRRKDMTWKQVAAKLGYSPDAESACRRRFWRAIDHLVLMFQGGDVQRSLFL